MGASLATLVYVIGIGGLFYLDRDSSNRVSKAVWLPVAYLWILGSRPLSVWLGMGAADSGDVQMDGSPVDAAFFGLLSIAAVCVLLHRGRRVLSLLEANWPILIYFTFCLLSVLWSDFPVVAAKRWIKATGDLMMILIIVTDKRPVAALSRMFSRTGFILMPLSLLSIKYFPGFGRGYDAWSGAQFNNGLTLNKNLLGLFTFLLLMGAVWRVLSLLRLDEVIPNRGRHLVAQGTLVAIGIMILIDANSVTSETCFMLGLGLMLAMNMKFVRHHVGLVHVLVLFLLIIASVVMLGGGGATVFQAVGRNPTLTGRTDIWAMVIPMAPNPLVGAGFESFWLNPSSRKMNGLFFYDLNEAHNGYIEVYLQLGWVGICLISVILIDGYRRSVRAFRHYPALGALLTAYVLTAAIYDITEAGFRMLGGMWIFLLLAVVQASTITAGVEAPQPVPASRRSDTELRTTNVLAAR